MPQCDFNTIIVNIAPILVLTVFFWMSFHWVNLTNFNFFQYRIFFILRKQMFMPFLISKDLNRSVSKKAK